MPLTFTTLGYVLLHIYDFDFGATIYLPSVECYEPTTPCIVATPDAYTKADHEALHQDCLDRGFMNWLNVAVVSDTCDEVLTPTEETLVAAFNKDCQVAGWLQEMMNYRNSSGSPGDDKLNPGD